MPLWAVIYAFTLEPNEELSAAIALGQEVYESNGCAGCHGPEGAGQGDVFPGFTAGEVALTFPDFNDQEAWIRSGSTGDVPGPDGGYGDPNRPGGQHSINTFSGQMPGFPDLSDEEVMAVTRYEREVLGEVPCEPELADRDRRGMRRVVPPGSTNGAVERRSSTRDARRAARGPGRRGRSRRGGGGVLAGEGRSRRRLRRAEVLPREKTCGDGLTPRAVHQLQEMGLEPAIVAAGHHRYDGLRAVRPRDHPRAGVAGAPGLPVVRLRRAPARPRPARGRAPPWLPAPPCTRAPRPSHRSSRAGSCVVRS